CHVVGYATQVGLTQALAGMGRSSQLVLVFVAALAGCDVIEVMETSYPNMATAESRGGISSGWIPQWLPDNAVDLREVHDIDTNESALAFKISGSANWRPLGQCQPVQLSAVTQPRFDVSWWPVSAEL